MSNYYITIGYCISTARCRRIYSSLYTGEEITLTGSAIFSEPGGGDGATYQWETGDGTVIDGQTATLSLLMNQESMLLTLMFGIQIPVFFQRDVKTQTLLIKL